jgi:hypothetical protein
MSGYVVQLGKALGVGTAKRKVMTDRVLEWQHLGDSNVQVLEIRTGESANLRDSLTEVLGVLSSCGKHDSVVKFEVWDDKRHVVSDGWSFKRDAMHYLTQVG